MKILFVRTYCPNPISYGSEIRSRRFIEYLRKKGDVDLLSLVSPEPQGVDTAYIKSHFRNHYYFDQKVARQRLTGVEKLKYLVPWQITGHYAKEFQEKLNKIVEENQYDLIFVFKLEPVFYFLQLPDKWHRRIVIDYDDLLSDVYMNYYNNIFTAFKNSYSLLLYQHKALVRFRRVFVCAEVARAKLPKKWRYKAGIIPNVFTAKPDDFFHESGSKNRLLFVGSLDYFPNTDGLKWFCRNIWPAFQEKYPGVILTVVGKTQKDANHVLALLNNPQNVEVVVNVPGYSLITRIVLPQ